MFSEIRQKEAQKLTKGNQNSKFQHPTSILLRPGIRGRERFALATRVLSLPMNGVRTSSSAASRKQTVTPWISKAIMRSYVAADEDVRTPFIGLMLLFFGVLSLLTSSPTMKSLDCCCLFRRYSVQLDQAGNAGAASASFGPRAQGADLFIHGPGQRHGLGQRRQNVIGVELGPFREGVVHGADDGLFNFGAAEIMAAIGEGGQIEIGRITATTAKMNSQD